MLRFQGTNDDIVLAYGITAGSNLLLTRIKHYPFPIPGNAQLVSEIAMSPTQIETPEFEKLPEKKINASRKHERSFSADNYKLTRLCKSIQNILLFLQRCQNLLRRTHSSEDPTLRLDHLHSSFM